jgi:hypothetical protein
MAAPDLSVLTSAISFSTIVVAVLAVYGAFALVLVAGRGAWMVIQAVRGGDVTSAPGWLRSTSAPLDRRERIAAIWEQDNPEESAAMRREARETAQHALSSGNYRPDSLMARAYRRSLESNS